MKLCPGYPRRSCYFTAICNRLTKTWPQLRHALCNCSQVRNTLWVPWRRPQALTLIIVDDMQATHASIISSWFTRRSHHHDTSVIYLVQNVFDKDPEHRTISLNATYIVLFTNPIDRSQVTHLDKQIYPGEGESWLQPTEMPWAVFRTVILWSTSFSLRQKDSDYATHCFLTRIFPGP